jgi:hypothetical protein
MSQKNSIRSDFKLGNLGAINQMDPAAIPITLYSTMNEALPVAQTTIARDFGLIIDPLQVQPVGNGGVGRVSSLVRSQTVEEFIYATHVGVVVIPDAKLFALNGVDTVLPQNPALTPQFDGFVPPTGIINGDGGARDATARPASFVWGHDTYQAAFGLLNAYDLRMKVARFEVFRELAANVGACVSGGHRGFSSTKTSAVPYIRAQNGLMQNRGGDRAFLPQTVTAGTPVTPAQPPLVDVSYGGVQLKGAFGGWYPLNGLLLAPGLPVNVLLERTAGDEGLGSYHQRMIDSLSDQQTDFVTYSERFQESVVGSIGFAGAKVWKAGLFRVGILIRGFALAPLACYQAYQDMSRYFTSLEKATMYRESGSIMMSMLPELLKTSGGAVGREATIGGVSLADYVAKKGDRLEGVQEIEAINFGPLTLPAP